MHVYSFSSIICQAKGEGNVTFPLSSNYVQFPLIFSKIPGEILCFGTSPLKTVSVVLSAKLKRKVRQPFPCHKIMLNFLWSFEKSQGGILCVWTFPLKIVCLQFQYFYHTNLIWSDYIWSDYFWSDYIWSDLIISDLCKWKNIFEVERNNYSLIYVWCHRIIDNLWMWHHQNQ